MCHLFSITFDPWSEYVKNGHSPTVNSCEKESGHVQNCVLTGHPSVAVFYLTVTHMTLLQSNTTWLNRRTHAKLNIESKKRKILAALAARANAGNIGSAAKKIPFLSVLRIPDSYDAKIAKICYL